MEDSVERVESALYGRMVRNAFAGFFKAGAIAAVVGAIVGAVMFGFGLLPESMMHAFHGSAALGGAITGAVAFGATAGSIGAIAGIQSTRDARRYVRFHEAARDDTLLPVAYDEVAASVPELASALQVSYRERLETQAQSPSTHITNL